MKFNVSYFNKWFDMFKYVIVGLFLSFVSSAYSQSSTDSIYTKVDKPAEFPGGKERLQEYLDLNLNGDQSTPFNIKEGKVILKFVVEKNGRINDVTVVQSLDPMFDQNLTRLFYGMPKWNPGLINGKPVRSYYTYSLNMNYYMH
jgi:TonB family protein